MVKRLIALKARRVASITFIAVFLMTLIVVVMTGCSKKTGQKLTSVRIALFPNITHSQGLLGKDNGQFQKALGDTRIDWKVFNAGPSEIEALLAGEVDIGYIGPGPAINGFTKSHGELKIIAGASNGGAVLVSRKGLNIRDVKSLSGKKVAIPQFGNTQDLMLRYLLHQNNLKDTTKGGTVEIHQAENPDIKTLLDKGDIDAALVPEPWGSRLINEINANVVLDYNQLWRNGDYSTAVVVARTDFIKQHPDIIEKFLKAHVDLTNYINENKEQAADKINQQINQLTKKPLSKEVLDQSFNRLKVTVDPQKDSISEYIKLLKYAGFLKEEPNVNELIDLSILKKVQRGK